MDRHHLDAEVVLDPTNPLARLVECYRNLD
jgi:hypothetical protein